MNNNKSIVHISIQETESYSLNELCELCDVQTDIIIEMIAYSIIEPMGKAEKKWLFNEVALVKVQTALRLQRDLQINLSGLALVLDLIEELDELRNKVSSLEQVIKSLTR